MTYLLFIRRLDELQLAKEQKANLLKKPIEESCERLKKAHADRNMAEIDAAMAALNQAWEAASGEMYKATQEGAAGGEGAPNNNPGGNGGDEVTDVDFEEVKDEK
jgi:molecular chaperone DnaK